MCFRLVFGLNILEKYVKNETKITVTKCHTCILTLTVEGMNSAETERMMKRFLLTPVQKKEKSLIIN